jgi:hypothetical protein
MLPPAAHLPTPPPWSSPPPLPRPCLLLPRRPGRCHGWRRWRGCWRLQPWPPQSQAWDLQQRRSAGSGTPGRAHTAGALPPARKLAQTEALGPAATGTCRAAVQRAGGGLARCHVRQRGARRGSTAWPPPAAQHHDVAVLQVVVAEGHAAGVPVGQVALQLLDLCAGVPGRSGAPGATLLGPPPGAPVLWCGALPAAPA